MDTFRPFLEGRHVTTAVRMCPGTPYVRGSRAAIESIVANILNNMRTLINVVVVLIQTLVALGPANATRAFRDNGLFSDTAGL